MTPTTPPQVCPFEADLKALLDGELPDLRRHQVEQHLAGCGNCSEVRRHLRQLTQEVQAMSEPVTCPESVTDRVLNALPAHGPSHLRWFEFSIVRWLAAGGLAAVMVAILFPMFGQARFAARKPSGSGYYESLPATAKTPDPTIEPGRMKTMTEARPPGGMAGGMGGGEAGGPTSASSAPMSQPAESPLFQDARKRQIGKLNGDPYGNVAGRALPKVGVATDEVSEYTRGKELDEVVRKVAKSASLTVDVDKRLENLQDEIAKKVVKDQGYVESMKLASPDQGRRTSRMALRVPVERFEATLEYLSGLGEVTAKELGGKDITGTWIDQRADVRTLRKKEGKYPAAYREARNRTEREKARQQLLNLRPVLKDSEEVFAATAKLAAMGRIDLTLTEEPQAKVRGDLGRDLKNTTKQASAAFMVALRVPATLLIWLGIFTPLWLPCLLVYRWATRMARGQQHSTVDNG